jgi:hypothetical protein
VVPVLFPYYSVQLKDARAMPDLLVIFCVKEPSRHEGFISYWRVIEVINALFDWVGLDAELF